MVKDKEKDKLLILLNDQGGIPIFSKFFSLDSENNISEGTKEEISTANESTILIGGFLEAILQLKNVVEPALRKVSEKDPLYVNIARADNGLTLVALSTTNRFTNLPKDILKEYIKTQKQVVAEKKEKKKFESLVKKSIQDPKSNLLAMKTELSEIVSFIMVFDAQGKYLFSTGKSPESVEIVRDEVTEFVINEYVIKNKIKKNYPSIIGLKKLKDSVIWHVKMFNHIFVFFTYELPDEFDIIKNSLLTFITNNVYRFITIAQTAKTRDNDNESDENIDTSRFIFIN